jgi:hypothetical protein
MKPHEWGTRQKDYLQKMVKMSPLQSYSIEIVKDDQETRGDRRSGERGADGLLGASGLG